MFCANMTGCRCLGFKKSAEAAEMGGEAADRELGNGHLEEIISNKPALSRKIFTFRSWLPCIIIYLISDIGGQTVILITDRRLKNKKSSQP